MMEFSGIKAQYQQYKSEIDAAVLAVLQKGDYILGQEVARLERRLAEYVGRKHCIAVSNGTDALVMALMSEGIGPGDCVFTTAFSFFATAEAISLVGAIPVFCDINPTTFNLDPFCLHQAIKRVQWEACGRPRAIITVDLFGLCADYDRLSDIAALTDMVLIEDAAQAMGASSNGQKACSFGKYSATSFFPSKPLGCYGDGGAVFCDDDAAAELLRSIRVHGKGRHKYENLRIGLNARLDEIQAAILNVKLDHLDQEIEQRNRVARRYTARLQGLVTTPRVESGLTCSFAQYTITLKNSQQRAAVQQALEAEGIPTMIYYPIPLNLQPAYRGLARHQMPNAQEAADRVLSLPMHPFLRDDEIDRVCECIQSALDSWEKRNFTGDFGS